MRSDFACSVQPCAADDVAFDGGERVLEGEAVWQAGGLVEGEELEGVGVGPCDRGGRGLAQPRLRIAPLPCRIPGTGLGLVRAFSGMPLRVGSMPSEGDLGGGITAQQPAELLVRVRRPQAAIRIRKVRQRPWSDIPEESAAGKLHEPP